MSEPKPARVRVTGPPRRNAVPRSRIGDIDDETPLGDLYLGALLREQLLLAVRIIVALVLTVGLAPLLFYLVPSLADVRLGRVPLVWLLLGVLVYPWLVYLGWRYVRSAERNDADFAELVDEIER